MYKKRINIYLRNMIALIIAIISCIALPGCKKFLEEKPDKKLALPASLNDLQLLLNNYFLFNTLYPAAGEAASDDYYLSDANWASMSSVFYRNLYVWKEDDENDANWSPAYQKIYNANLILETLADLKYTNKEKEKAHSIKGHAYFLRALNYWHLAQLYIKPYNPGSAASDLGLPLRLSTDFTNKTVRTTVNETYDQIIHDSKIAITSLPLSQNQTYYPSKAAAYALLARVYLSMNKFKEAGDYADSSLTIKDHLMDYNSLNSAALLPITRGNIETLFEATALSTQPLLQSRWRVDSILYNTYDSNDLRRSVFFRRMSDGSYTFKGSYTGTANAFAGLATNEVYLIKAEALARAGNKEEALNTLNTLLVKRWKTGSFIPVQATSDGEALSKILQERRKELLFRMLRWSDLRRFTFDPALEVKPKRILNGQHYILEPQSPRYVFKIPKNVIEFSGITQNP